MTPVTVSIAKPAETGVRPCVRKEMPRPLKLDPDRLFPADPSTRSIARVLYGEVAALPIVSPHGHTDPVWFATDAPWSDPTALLLAPDHYLYRLLYSQGVPLPALGVPSRSGPSPADPREAWRLFADHYYLFRGTPSRLWLDQVFAEVFGLDVALQVDTADLYFDRLSEKLATPAFRPRDRKSTRLNSSHSQISYAVFCL